VIDRTATLTKRKPISWRFKNGMSVKNGGKLMKKVAAKTEIDFGQ